MSSIQFIARSQCRDSRETKSVYFAECREHQKIIISMAPRHDKISNQSRGLMAISGKTLPCILGRSALTAFKREGDGATPIAEMALISGFYRADRWPLAYRVPWMMPLPADLGWCDAPAHPNYNQAVKRPFSASHEILKREDRLYDCVLILDWNMSRRARNRGSAIFMHLTSENKKPTEGCIALDPKDMRHVIKCLKPYDRFIVRN